jgi:hypothetical protein
MAETLRLQPGALEWREIESEIVAVDTRTAAYLAVNQSGAVLWPPLVRGTDRSELVDALISEFGIDRDRASSDVDAFLAMLAEQELLQR